MQRRKVAKILFGAAMLVAIFWAAGVGNSLPDRKAFTNALPTYARPYADVILRVASETDIPPHLLFAIGDRESRWGTALDSSGRGDNGNGHGIMQIDHRYHQPWISRGTWRDPYENVKYGAQVLLDTMNYMRKKGLSGAEQQFAAIAAYNKGAAGVFRNVAEGRSADTGTTGNNYASDVVARANKIATALV